MATLHFCLLQRAAGKGDKGTILGVAPYLHHGWYIGDNMFRGREATYTLCLLLLSLVVTWVAGVNPVSSDQDAP